MNHRILIVEDHGIVREGILALIRHEPGFEVCGSAATGCDALRLAKESRPDVILLDFFLEDKRDGAELIRELVALPCAPKVLVLSLHREEDLAERALKAGARGYVSKKEGPELLIEALRVVLLGAVYASTRTKALFFERVLGTDKTSAPHALSRLTERELQIYQLLGAGLSTTAIAQRLSVSERTVATHRENIKGKLGYSTAEEVLTAASQWVSSSFTEP